MKFISASSSADESTVFSDSRSPSIPNIHLSCFLSGNLQLHRGKYVSENSYTYIYIYVCVCVCVCVSVCVCVCVCVYIIYV